MSATENTIIKYLRVPPTIVNLGRVKVPYPYYYREDIDPPEEWQREDIDFIVDEVLTTYDGGSANWSEMGCKKTSTTLWFMQRILAEVENPSVLIITTRSGKGSYFKLGPGLLPPGWKLFNVSMKKISLFINDDEVKIPGLESLPLKLTFPHVVVTHYDIFARKNKGKPKLDEDNLPIIDPETGEMKFMPWTQGDYITEHEWDLVIIDEAHRIKNKDAKWTHGIKELKAKYRHVMTGTGFINRPDEIWSLINFADKKRFRSYWSFRETFCAETVWDGYRTIEGIKPEMKDTFRKLVRSVGVRRTLDEVMPHVKKPKPIRIDVELSAIQRKMYTSITRELRAMDKNGVPFYSPNVLAALQRLRQISVATPEVIKDYFDEKLGRRIFEIKLREPSSKLDAVMEVVDGLQWDEDAKQPLVVFSNFRDPLELLGTRLDKAKIPYIHLKQSDNDRIRYEKWNIDFPKFEHRVFMSTLKLGGESIDLTPARHVCFLDRSWSPKDNSQGIGRIRRPGQTGEPVVINIEAIKTTDQRIEHVVNVKSGWFNEIFGDEDDE